MERRFGKRIFLGIFLIAGVLAINTFIFKNFVQNSLSYFWKKPGIFFISQLSGFYQYGRGLIEVSRIERENVELKNQNRELLGKISLIEALDRENRMLRKELGVAQKLSGRLVLAKIFNVEKSPVSSTILIDKGESDGVKNGMAIVSGGNSLIGRVDTVFKNSALVILSNDPRFVASIRVVNSQILANTKGDLDNGLIINLIMAKDEIKKGDTIVTSGLDSFKEALVVGRISKVEAQNGELFKKVWARPTFDFSLSPEVFVILE